LALSGRITWSPQANSRAPFGFPLKEIETSFNNYLWKKKSKMTLARGWGGEVVVIGGIQEQSSLN
jgi:hypothetical protein